MICLQHYWVGWRATKILKVRALGDDFSTTSSDTTCAPNWNASVGDDELDDDRRSSGEFDRLGLQLRRN